MNKTVVILVSIVICIIVFLSIFFGATPTGKSMWNNYFHAVQKADDDTNYNTRKKVEDTCRAMISTYEADKAEYENNIKLYDETKDEYYRAVANGYRQQANSTASEYNNYILKNSYVFENNVPADISYNLEIVK